MFGKKIADLYGFKLENAEPINSTEINDRAVRSLNLTTEVSKIERKLNIRMPSINQEIKKLRAI